MSGKKPIGPEPADLKKKLLRKWEKGVYFAPEVNVFPLRIPLGSVSASVITDRFDEVRWWIALYAKEESVPYRVEWKEINHRLLGRNRLPAALIFDIPEDLARFVGRLGEYKRFIALREKLAKADPLLADWADEAPFDLLGCGDDLERLLCLWRWMVDHPRPGIYVRQIDLPGIDTKFTEKYKRLLSVWLDLTAPQGADDRYRGVKQFERRYGYKSKPDQVRIRFLDPALYWFGCSDITLDSCEFARLYSPKVPPGSMPPFPDHVFVVENDITGLSFPDVAGGMVIFGGGYCFDHLKEADWLNETGLWYWGDLDTHGFCILDQFRGLFPRARSFLMDRKTFLDHEISWGREPKPADRELTRLSPEELVLYGDLRFNRLGENLRLEQEFIRFGALERFLEESGFLMFSQR